MKTKYPSMFGLLIVFVLVACSVVPVLANPQPVEASSQDASCACLIETPIAVTIGPDSATGLSPPAVIGPDSGIYLQVTDGVSCTTPANMQAGQFLQNATGLGKTDIPIIFNSTRSPAARHTYLSLQGFRLNHPPWIAGGLLLLGLCAIALLMVRCRNTDTHNSSSDAGHTTMAHGTTGWHVASSQHQSATFKPAAA